MNKNEIEVWKVLPGVMGVEVSTLGRVRTLDRVISSENGTRYLKGKVLKKSNDKDGYLLVHIPINGKRPTKRVHRLVAQTFIPNPDNLPQVNHKNCNRADNRVSNLEWCSGSYNQQYREDFGESQGKPVFAVNLNTLEVSQFKSQREASRVIGVLQSHINSVIKGQRSHTGGFWFVNDDENATDVINRKLHEINAKSNH